MPTPSTRVISNPDAVAGVRESNLPKLSIVFEVGVAKYDGPPVVVTSNCHEADATSCPGDIDRRNYVVTLYGHDEKTYNCIPEFCDGYREVLRPNTTYNYVGSEREMSRYAMKPVMYDEPGIHAPWV